MSTFFNSYKLFINNLTDVIHVCVEIINGFDLIHVQTLKKDVAPNSL